MTIIDRAFAIAFTIVLLFAGGMLIVHGIIAGIFVTLILVAPLAGIKWLLTGRLGSKGPL